MRVAVFFALLVCWTQAEPGWRPSSEYIYNIQSRSLTVLHELAQEYEGVLMKASLKIQTSNTPGTTLGKIVRAQYANIHTTLPNGWSSDISEAALNWTSIDVSNNTFKIIFNQGLVKKLVLEKELHTWEGNFIRAVISNLQLDLKGENKLDQKKYDANYQADQSNVFFTTMEESITGHCETQYDVSSLPKYVSEKKPELAPWVNYSNDHKNLIDIMKVSNFSNCKQHIVYHWGIHDKYNWDAGSSNIGSAIKRSATVRIIIKGTFDNFTILSSLSTNKMIISPFLYKSQKAMVVSQMNVTLKNMTHSDQQPPAFNGTEETTLLFDYENKPVQNIDDIQYASGIGLNNSRSKRDTERQQNSHRHYLRRRRDIEPPTSTTAIESSTAPTIATSSAGTAATTSSSSLTGSTSSSLQNTTEHSASPNPEPSTTETIISTSDAPRSTSMNSTISPQTATNVSANTTDFNINENSSISNSSKRTNAIKVNVTKGLEEPLISPFFSLYTSFKDRPILHPEEVGDTIQNITEQIGTELLELNTIIEQNTLTKFCQLTCFLANVEYSVLEKISDQVYEPSDSSNNKRRAAWTVLRDAVGQAGTGPALFVIKYWILNQRVTNEEASELISVLTSTAHVPNQEYIDAIFDIVKDPYIQKQDVLNISTILTFTHIVRQSLVDSWSMKAKYPVHTFGPLTKRNDSKLENEYIPYIEQSLKNAVETQDSQKIHIYIKALGNIGHPKIFNIFKAYLQNNTQISTFQKVLIVMSLDKAITLYPAEARNFLYPIYINEEEPYEVRTAAVFQIMNTNPPANILQKMAEFTNYDSNYQVISTVKSALESLAQQEETENYLLAENAKSAMPFLTPQDFGIQYSHSFFKAGFLKQIGNLGYSQNINYIGSSDSILPKGLYANFERFLGGLSTGTENYGVMFSSIKNMSNVLENLLQHVKDTKTDENMSKTKPSEQQNTTDGITFDNIAKQENYNPEATILYHFAGMEKFVTFGRNYPSSISKWLQEKIKEMRDGQKFKYTKLFNRDTFFLAVPDVAGHLMQITYKVPSVLQIESETLFQAKYNEKPEEDRSSHIIPQEIYWSGRYRLGYAFKKHTNIGFITLFNGNRYIAGYKEQAIFNVPVAVNASLQSHDKDVELKFSLFPYKNKLQGLYSQYSSQPYTRRDNIIDIAQKKDVGVTTIIRTSPPKQIVMKFGKYGSLEMNFTAERNINEYFPNQQNVDDYDSASTLNFPLTHKAIESSNIILNYRFPNAESSIDFRMHFSANKPGSGTEKLQGKESVKARKSFIGGKNNSTIEMDLSFNQDSQPAYKMSLSINGDKSLRLAMVQRSPEKGCKNCKNQSAISIAVNSRWGDVPHYNFSEAINIIPKSKMNATLHIGHANKPFAVAECHLDRSDQRAKYLMNQPITKICKYEMDSGHLFLPACRVASYRASLLDQHSCTVKFNNLNEESKLYRNIYTAIYQLFYNHVVEHSRTHSGAKNQASLNASFAPDFQFVNISYLSPHREIMLKNITVHSLMRPLLKIHPLYTANTRLIQHLFNAQYNPTCVLDKATVNTFDNRTYSIHPGPCWHVLAAITKKSQSNITEQDILVLVRDESKRIVIRIAVDGHLVDILPASQNSFSLYANTTNRHYYISGKSTAEVTLEGKNKTIHLQGTIIDKGIVQVSITEHFLEFIYDGKRVMLITKHAYRNQTFGLCGTLNGEPADDFDAPTLCASKDIKILSSRYAIVDACHGQALEWANKAHNESCLATNGTFVNLSIPRLPEENTSETDFKENSTANPQEKFQADPRCMATYLQVLQSETHTCFSKKSVPQCKENCLPINMVKKKVNFHCISNSQISEYFIKTIKNGAKPDFSKKVTTKTVITELPTGCAKKEISE